MGFKNKTIQKKSKDEIKFRPEILLCPNIPKPLHGLAPRIVLGKEWWDNERREAYKKTNNYCAACEIHASDAKYYKRLEAHESYNYDYKKGTLEYIESVALCHSCHNFIHSGRMRHMVNKGEISLDKELDILTHGERILNKNKLIKKEYTGKCAEWNKWRMIINGIKYKGKFNSYEEWYKYYNH